MGSWKFFFKEWSSTNFVILCFPFYLAQNTLFPFLIYFMTAGLFRNVLFSFKVLMIVVGHRTYFVWLKLFQIYWDLFYCLEFDTFF